MSVYESAYTPERRKGRQEEKLSKSLVKQRLDSLIYNDYAVMRKGREMDEGDLLLKNHNILVLEYVRGIYDEYHIPDPLADNASELKIALTPSAKKTKKKKILLMSIQAMKYQTPSRNKLNNDQSSSDNDGEICEEQSTFIKKDILQNETTIRGASLSYFDDYNKKAQLLNEEMRRQQQSRILQNSVEIQLPKSQVKRFKGFNSMLVEKQIKIQPIEEEPSQRSEKVPKIVIPKMSEQNEKEDSFFLPPMPTIQPKYTIRQQIKSKEGSGYVNQSFRYCVGCEQALLHANIKIHQKTCSLFQQVFRMPADDIVRYLKEKIKKFEQSIKKSCMQLMRGDVDEIQQSSMRMMQESKYISNNGVITQGFERQYEKVVDIGKRWCLITQQINKVNWFLKIRQRIKQEFEL